MTAADLDRWADDQMVHGSPDYRAGYRDGIQDAVQAAKDLTRAPEGYVVAWRWGPSRSGLDGRPGAWRIEDGTGVSLSEARRDLARFQDTDDDESDVEYAVLALTRVPMGHAEHTAAAIRRVTR